MDEFLKEALEIVKMQAKVRTMTEEEITSMVHRLALGLKALCETEEEAGEAEAPLPDPSKAVREKSITCLECGKSFRILTRKHLEVHELTPETYREKYGIKSGTPLVCKLLQRERRRRMKDMKLWERRRKESAA